MQGELPTYSSLRLRNVRCFEDAETPLHPRMTVLIGENGSGKSTIADALASLTYGDGEGLRKFPQRRDAPPGSIELFADGSEQPVAYWKTFEGHRSSDDHIRLPEQRWLFAYGRYRRVQFIEDFDEELAEDRKISESGPLAGRRRLAQLSEEAMIRRTITLSQPDSRLLKNLSLNLIAIYEACEYDPRMKSLWEKLGASLASLKHGLSGIHMVEGPTGYVPRVVRNGLELPINELSDGYQAILVIVLDLLMRLPMLFPIDEEPWNQPMTVVIDEVDLHLHVRWQRTVLKQLTELFPATQFIVTTHSPAVVQGAIDEGYSVVLMKETKGAVQPKKLSKSMSRKLSGADIGSLLVEEKLFGVDSRYSAKYEAQQEELDRLRRKVERGTATEEDHQRIFELSEVFENLMAGEEERRADGGFISQISKLNRALVQDLAAELEKAKKG